MANNIAGPDPDVSLSKELSHQPNRDVLILGIGNILLSDEGAGIKALEILRERYSVPDQVELIDGGTIGFELLYNIENRSHLIIVDAVKSGKPPGTVVRINDPHAFFQKKISPHQIGLCDVLALADISNALPKNMVLFGIEPKHVSTGLDISPEVKKGIYTVVDEIAVYLRNINLSL
ncbi:MAG: HyaD/HybD family hydrogenase maturation endopeptidase [Desulfobacterales bacterium]|jgi:hydrogenase maturation protease|nr:HyaD/HybD family hydrogenase maturation endopeptidase [Desulfobacteraceae bacterium]MBT7085236.1 HyaD/HybD family hydrogenase maturation endopeptidase [Desulfobacterales bacterium]MBT7696353.1 HyaD/HybD family hydrogenase maturation endopeptidase [Desulfobacterales bacterium]